MEGGLPPLLLLVPAVFLVPGNFIGGTQPRRRQRRFPTAEPPGDIAAALDLAGGGGVIPLSSAPADVSGQLREAVPLLPCSLWHTPSMAAKENADIPLTGRRRTLLPIQHHGESARCLSCPDRTILLTRAPGRPLVYGLPSHLPAMTGFRPSGFPPRPYPCAYSADRVGHCTPFLPGENLTELKARAIAMRRHRTHIFCCHQKAALS